MVINLYHLPHGREPTSTGLACRRRRSMDGARTRLFMVALARAGVNGEAAQGGAPSRRLGDGFERFGAFERRGIAEIGAPKMARADEAAQDFAVARLW